ncbi:MAG: U32 family peptidase [Ruminococcus sp.]|jgi:putative protease|nr:U32 family peptidase [Ruminococcus sp.]
MNSKKIELLSPAGDSERLRFAVLYGADAVYVGTSQFSMRSTPPNFDRESLAADVEFAHKNGVKVYLTCNTLPRNSEVTEFAEYIDYAADIGIDALIISDLGLLSIAKKQLPDMEIHMSTQTGIVNYQTAATLYDMGVSRVVLARELSLDEISEIRAKTPAGLELECFVHGSMCVSYSGRCLLSEYLTGRDANRGVCAQSCRWKYTLMEEKRPGQYFPIENDEKGSYILNANDLNMLPYLDKLFSAGVTSFKIEGRAKSLYYVSIVTNAYKSAINLLETSNYFPNSQIINDLNKELDKVSHRPYGTGFYFTTPNQYLEDGGYIREYDIAAVVIEHKDGMLYCEQRNKIFPNTDAEIVIPNAYRYTNSIFIPIKIGDLYDENGMSIPDTKHAKMVFSFKYIEGNEIDKNIEKTEFQQKTIGTNLIPRGSIIRCLGLK